MALYDALEIESPPSAGKTRKALWIDETYYSIARANSPGAKTLTAGRMAKALRLKISFSHLNGRDPAPFVLFCTRWLPRPVARYIRKAVRAFWPIKEHRVESFS
jgi:hypothetical protein